MDESTRWKTAFEKYESGVISGLDLVKYLCKHLLDNPSDEATVYATLSSHPDESMANFAGDLKEWLNSSRAAIEDGVRLSKGLLISRRIMEMFRDRDFATLEWEIVEFARHPGMDEQQFKLIPRRIAGILMPMEELAFAVISKYREGGQNKEAYCVSDATKYCDPGRVH